MTIGIDIDDVLYNTSKMIEAEAPALMQKYNITENIDMSTYEWELMFHTDTATAREIVNQLSFNSYTYLNQIAIRAIKQYKQIHPETKFCIVSNREITSAEIIVQYISGYFYFTFDKIFSTKDKFNLCKREHVDVLLDDHAENIKPFMHSSKPLAVLISTPDISHNKTFASQYDRVLTDWEDLPQLVKED